MFDSVEQERETGGGRPANDASASVEMAKYAYAIKVRGNSEDHHQKIQPDAKHVAAFTGRGYHSEITVPEPNAFMPSKWYSSPRSDREGHRPAKYHHHDNRFGHFQSEMKVPRVLKRPEGTGSFINTIQFDQSAPQSPSQHSLVTNASAQIESQPEMQIQVQSQVQPASQPQNSGASVHDSHIAESQKDETSIYHHISDYLLAHYGLTSSDLLSSIIGTDVNKMASLESIGDMGDLLRSASALAQATGETFTFSSDGSVKCQMTGEPKPQPVVTHDGRAEECLNHFVSEARLFEPAFSQILLKPGVMYRLPPTDNARDNAEPLPIQPN